MDYDDIVIGSGLTALATVVGLPVGRRVLVLAGPQNPIAYYYDAQSRVPCAYLGLGGLGNFWHGVVPTAFRHKLGVATDLDFAALFNRFFRYSDVESKLGKPCLFVPLRPIRPRREWPRALAERRGSLLIEAVVERFEMNSAGTTVRTPSGTFRSRRLWICAGALHTPRLLDRSLGTRVSRDHVSDHVLCYLGQIDTRKHPRISPSAVQRTRDGIWIEAHFDVACTGLYTLKPARFAFKRLDYGIELRSIFGLPTGGVLAKLLRAGSPGLVAEAVYNRLGLFPQAQIQSAYVQFVTTDGLQVREDGGALELRKEVIIEAAQLARSRALWPELIPSERPEIFIPMIHLHHSVDMESLARSGINSPESAVRVMDASVYSNIGPEHHSFKLMVEAFTAAKQTV